MADADVSYPYSVADTDVGFNQFLADTDIGFSQNMADTDIGIRHRGIEQRYQSGSAPLPYPSNRGLLASGCALNTRAAAASYSAVARAFRTVRCTAAGSAKANLA